MRSDCMFKLTSYKLWDGKKLKDDYGNNREYFESIMNKPYKNYRHELYQRVGNKWVLLVGHKE